MRRLLFLFTLCFSPLAHAQMLGELHWLKGCWRAEGGRSLITEVWTAPPMPAMLGYSYTTREGHVRAWEQTRIELIDGVPHFVAMPNGAPPVAFRMRATSEPNHVWFDNPAHDFPQTVEYRREGDRLHAAVSAADGADRIAFAYRRIRCSAALRP